MQKISMVRCKNLIYIALLVHGSACNRTTYPCPDIQGGTEVVKSGSKEGLKKVEPEMDDNGRLMKRSYSHSGMKKRKKQ